RRFHAPNNGYNHGSSFVDLFARVVSQCGARIPAVSRETGLASSGYRADDARARHHPNPIVSGICNVQVAVPINSHAGPCREGSTGCSPAISGKAVIAVSSDGRDDSIRSHFAYAIVPPVRQEHIPAAGHRDPDRPAELRLGRGPFVSRKPSGSATAIPIG